MPPSSSRTDIDLAIIGDGLAAAMLVWHLHQSGHDLGTVTVFGRGDLGRGKAYGGIHPDLRLNVRANLMNVTLDEGLSFAEWSATALDDPEAASPAGEFYRRRDFSRFVRHLLQDGAGAAVSHSRTDIRQVQPREDGSWQLETADDGPVTAARVVLATGNPEPQPPFAIPGHGVITAPWYGDWPEQINPRDTITIIGSGLTAMDAILILYRRGHEGPVHLVSPRAVLPPPQADWKPGTAVAWPMIISASQFFRFWRQHLPDEPWESPVWQEGFEKLRGGFSTAWQRMPRAERRKALYRLGAWWQPARYRAAPQTSQAAAAMLESGQLTLVQGRVSGVTTENKRLMVHQAKNTPPITADAVVMAIGSGRDALVDSLAKKGLLSDDRIGIEVDEDHHVLGRDGQRLAGLYAIGPQTAFSRGDIVGASGVSREARQLATHLKEQAHG